MLYEWKKIFSKSNVLLLLVAFFVNFLFMILIVYGQKSSGMPEMYRKVFCDMETMTNMEKYTYLEQMTAQCVESGTFQEYEIRFGLEEITENCRIAANYEDYLNEMIAAEQEKIEIPILGGTDGFLQRNADEMQKRYQKLHGTDVSFEAYKGLEFANLTSTNILLVFLMTILSTESLIYEKEQGMLSVLRCCKRGRGRLLFHKMGALLVTTFVISGIFLMQNTLFGGYVYGVGNLKRPLQSLPGYEACALKISVVAGLVIIWILRSIALVVIEAFVMLLTICSYQVWMVLGGCIFMGCLSYLLYSKIGLQSMFVVFHYINPVGMLEAEPLIKGEVNLNILGMPVHPLVVALIAAAFIYVAINVILFRKFLKNEEIQRRKILKEVRNKKHMYRVSILSGELYKLFVTNRALLLMMILLGIQIFSCQGRSYVPSPMEMYENISIMELKGEIGVYQKEWIESEQERLGQIGNEESYQIEKDVMNRRILPLTAQLEEIKKKNGQAQYVNQIGYEKLFGIGDRIPDHKNIMLYTLLLVCCISTYMTMEKTSHMDTLVGTTKAGVINVERRKKILTVFLACIGSILVWFPDYVWLIQNYNLHDWNARMSWLLAFGEFPYNMTTGEYFGVLLVVRLAGGIFVSLVMLWVSGKCRQSVTALGLNSLIFLLPAILAFFKIPHIEQLSFSAFLDGNIVLQSEANIWIYLMILCSGIVALSWNRGQGTS